MKIGLSIGPRIIISFLWMQVTSEKFGLYAGNVKFNTQNEDWIKYRPTYHYFFPVDARNIGKIWSACGQREIQYTE